MSALVECADPACTWAGVIPLKTHRPKLEQFGCPRCGGNVVKRRARGEGAVIIEGRNGKVRADLYAKVRPEALDADRGLKRSTRSPSTRDA